MQLRFPWILSRRRLLAAVLLDSALFVVLYNGLFLHHFGRLPDGSIFLPILWVTWVLSSYVLGRYQGVDCFRVSGRALPILQQLVKTTLVVTFSLSGTLTYFWLFKSNAGSSLFRSFIIPYLASLGLSSLLIQSILGTWLRNRSTGADQWRFLGREDEYRGLLHHLIWSRLRVSLNHMSYEELNQPGLKPIVVENFTEETSVNIQKLLKLQHQGCTVIDSKKWCEEILQRFPSEFLSDADLLSGEFSFPTGSFESRLKRLGDVLLSALLLFLTSPVLLISSLLIKLEDGGPIFYSQIRTGLEGTPFTIWKLRSMRVNAEREGAQWVSHKDTRITKMGSLLRQTRVDELPQLWCVFNGTMSLIGPRPERPEFDLELDRRIPHYRLRQRIRPGLSGWAQVNYPYGASVQDAANKLSFDLYYLRNFSFWLDLLIFLKTIKLVFNANGAIPIQSDTKQ
ncbi:exopolysaccharide biosynthesis polyprenyl glycosylphosphotransferase [bacterium]|nr:exopolysaccharide biosynthesis polyprenyl glycosylphosphotransferase [bacterium]